MYIITLSLKIKQKVLNIADEIKLVWIKYNFANQVKMADDEENEKEYRWETGYEKTW